MIPSRTLVVLTAFPVAFALGVAFEPSLLWPLLALDGVIIIGAVIDLLWARGTKVTVEGRVAPEVMSIGRANVVRVQLRSHSSRPLTVTLFEDLFEHGRSPDLPLKIKLAPGSRAEASYRVVPTRRGAYTLGDHWIRHRSPLGLWIRQHRIAAEVAVRVYPDVQAVRAYELMAPHNRAVAGSRLTRYKGGESEFEALRNYNRGDQYRAIDWKATARRCKLICRDYQLERNQSVMFALDSGRLMTAVVDELPLFDHALNSALMMAHIVGRTGDDAGVMTFADETRSYVPPLAGRQMARRFVQATFDVHPELRETDFRAAFLRVAGRLRKRSLIVIMTQVIDEGGAKDLLETTRTLGRRHLPLCVLLRDSQLEQLTQPSGGGVGALYDAAAAAELLARRDQLVRDLRNAGALVLDVLPADLTPALVNQYLEVKVRHLL
ncbi:MAG: DUF58 domain-containing protein [Nannocystaceae bacterium]|nr:DUF58 domain-containing protein [Nannocystaceae bacterium]